MPYDPRRDWTQPDTVHVVTYLQRNGRPAMTTVTTDQLIALRALDRLVDVHEFRG